MEQQKIRNLQDVEQQSFYVLKETEDDKIADPLKNYLYNNPTRNINTIFFVGSIYLRDKYLEKHPELLKNK